MAGLNNLLSDTQQTQTTLPSWYDAAQQQVVQGGQLAATAAPALNQTVAQGAINTLQPGAQNPFTQAQNALSQISSGAANPWIVDQSTGAVTPNTSTALGGLFQAQRDQLNQVLPNITAGADAAGIGSGQFGSLRSQTASDKARADALANLTAQQMTTALQGQQYGSQAAANLGQVAGQGIQSAMNVGLAQQNAPYQNITNLANLLASIKAPETVTSQTQMSPLTQAATVANTLQGSGAAGGLGSLLFGSAASGNPTLPNGQPNPNYKPATGGLFGTGGLGNLLGGSSSSSSGGGYTSAGGTEGTGSTGPNDTSQTTGPNPYAGMADYQIQEAINRGYGSNPTQAQIDYLNSLPVPLPAPAAPDNTPVPDQALPPDLINANNWGGG